MTNEEFLEFINKADRADNVSISTIELRKLVDKHTNQRVIEELELILEEEDSEWVSEDVGYSDTKIVYSRDIRNKIKELKQ